MRNKLFGLMAGAAASALMVSAAAADGYATGSLKDAPVPVAYNWNGLSVGVGVGVGKIDQDVQAKAWRHDKLLKRKCYEPEPEIEIAALAIAYDCDDYEQVAS